MGVESNEFIRRLLCIKNRPIFYKDFYRAKRLLSKNIVGLYGNSDTAYQDILSLFSKKATNTTIKCMRRYLYYENKNLEIIEQVLRSNLKLLMEFNKFDMLLYKYTVGIDSNAF